MEHRDEIEHALGQLVSDRETRRDAREAYAKLEHRVGCLEAAMREVNKSGALEAEVTLERAMAMYSVIVWKSDSQVNCVQIQGGGSSYYGGWGPPGGLETPRGPATPHLSTT